MFLFPLSTTDALALPTTRVGIIRNSSSAKPDSRVTCFAVVFVVSHETDSCFCVALVPADNIESLLVTLGLQRGL